MEKEDGASAAAGTDDCAHIPRIEYIRSTSHTSCSSTMSTISQNQRDPPDPEPNPSLLKEPKDYDDVELVSSPSSTTVVCGNHVNLDSSLSIEQDEKHQVEIFRPKQDFPRRKYHSMEGLESEQNDHPTSCWESYQFRAIFYLSAFAILGETLRVLLGEMFGKACEYPDDVVPWLRPFADRVCVTASGYTSQTGGALFTDLPANVIGSFFMGLFSLGSNFNVASTSAVSILWLRPDHFFQQWHDVHLAMRTGFCGSLTTFASWNSQMVVMMDGSYTELGSQVVSSIFGYVIGLQAAFVSLKSGQHVAFWLHNYHLKRSVENKNSDPPDLEEGQKRLKSWSGKHVEEEMVEWRDEAHDDRKSQITKCSTFDTSEKIDFDMSTVAFAQEKSSYLLSMYKFLLASLPFREKSSCLLSVYKFLLASLPFLLVAALFLVFGLKDYYNPTNSKTSFYRVLWMSSIFTPPGALLRWKLSRLNKGKNPYLPWIPTGTFLANVLASLISIAVIAVMNKYDDSLDSWTIHILTAIKTGFAGSLSTVSTFVDEIDNLNDHYQRQGKAYFYSWGTVITACLGGLCVYSAIVRL